MKVRQVFPLLLTLTLTGCLEQSALNHYVKGQIALDNGDHAVALQELSKAIEENPQLGPAWLARGMLKKDEGNFSESATDLEHAQKLEPHSFDANFQLGTVYQALKRFRDAIEAYQVAVQIRPLNPELNMDLAISYTQIGEPLRALPYAKRAVEGDPNSPFTQANLGILYSQLGRSDDAVTSLRRSIDMSSKQPEVYVALANEYFRRGSFELAKNVLTAATKLPPDPGVQERLGLAWYKLNDIDKAMACYSAALGIEKDYVPAINGLGVMHMTIALKSDPPDAIEAHQAVGYWAHSLKLNADQPAIQTLVERYKTFQ